MKLNIHHLSIFVVLTTIVTSGLAVKAKFLANFSNSLNNPNDSITCIKSISTGDIVVGMDDGSLFLIDNNGNCKAKFGGYVNNMWLGHTKKVITVIEYEKNVIVSAGKDGFIKFWRIPTNDQPHIFQAPCISHEWKGGGRIIDLAWKQKKKEKKLLACATNGAMAYVDKAGIQKIKDPLYASSKILFSILNDKDSKDPFFENFMANNYTNDGFFCVVPCQKELFVINSVTKQQVAFPYDKENYTYSTGTYLSDGAFVLAFENEGVFIHGFDYEKKYPIKKVTTYLTELPNKVLGLGFQDGSLAFLDIKNDKPLLFLSFNSAITSLHYLPFPKKENNDVEGLLFVGLASGTLSCYNITYN